MFAALIAASSVSSLHRLRDLFGCKVEKGMRGGSVRGSSTSFDAPPSTAEAGEKTGLDGREAHLLGSPSGSRRDEVAVDALTADVNLERHDTLLWRKVGR